MMRRAAIDERDGTPRSDASDSAPACPNCGVPVGDRYCPHCGQSIHDHTKSIAHLAEELMEGFLHFDSRFLRTAAALFTAPGRMTADYNEGKRASYVPPIRLYLFVSVLFFVTLAMTHIGLVGIVWRPPHSLEPDASELAEQQEDPADLTPPHYTVRLRDLKAIPDFRFFVDLGRWKHDDREAANALVKAAEEGGGGLKLRIARGIAQGAENTEEFNHLFSGHLSKLMLLMMPLFASMLALLYWRQHRYFMEHLTFSLHFHCFVFIVLVIVTLGQKIFGAPLSEHPAVAGGLSAGFGIYLLLSMKRAYGQGWVRTPIKFMLVSTSYFVIFVIAFGLVLTWSLPGMS